MWLAQQPEPISLVKEIGELVAKHGTNVCLAIICLSALALFLFWGLPRFLKWAFGHFDIWIAAKLESDKKRDSFMTRMEENSTLNTQCLMKLEKTLSLTHQHASACVAQNIATEHMIDAHKAEVEESHPHKEEVHGHYDKALDVLSRARFNLSKEA